MPLYVCNARAGVIPQEAKPAIAKDVTDIHCEVTDAPPTFVHCFFFEDAPHTPLGDADALIFGSIRAGRTDAQKAEIRERMAASLVEHAGLAADKVMVMTTDTPASWVMEGGDLLPEPGEEAAWLERHEAKLAAAARTG